MSTGAQSRRTWIGNAWLLTLFSLLGLLAVTGFVQVSAGTTYVVNPSESHIVVHVDKSGIFSFAGHTHEVAAPVAEGTIVVDPADLAGATIRVTFDAAALQVTGKGEPAKDVPEVQRTMASARVLDVSRFPRIVFASREIQMLGRDGTRLRLRVTGDLTLHGQTMPAAANVDATLASDRLTASGTLTVKQTDFGIEPVTAGAGTVRVKNEVRIDFTLVAHSAASR